MIEKLHKLLSAYIFEKDDNVMREQLAAEIKNLLEDKKAQIEMKNKCGRFSLNIQSNGKKIHTLLST